MICPKCLGKGLIPMYRLEHAHIEGAAGDRLVTCDYDGCHNGQVHCCEPTGSDDA